MLKAQDIPDRNGAYAAVAINDKVSQSNAGGEELPMIDVPDDFPRAAPGVVAGVQPKVCVVLCKDGKYRESSSDEVRSERHEICEDLAHQLCAIVLKDAEQHSHQAVLKRVTAAVQRKDWTTGPETTWLIQRLRHLLGW